MKKTAKLLVLVLALVLVVLLFAGMGERLRRLLDPASVHQ